MENIVVRKSCWAVFVFETLSMHDTCVKIVHCTLQWYPHL